MSNDLFIEATKTTPKVDFSQNGKLYIEGRSYPDNTPQFYEPLINWVKEVNCAEITLNIKLNYFNTSSTKQLYVLFKSLENNPSCNKFTINWFYEEDDDDTLESGKYFSRLLKTIPFNYVEYSIAG